MTTPYHIVLVERPENRFCSMVFQDIIELLRLSFRSLGIPCTSRVNQFDPDAINVVLGYHLLDGPDEVARHRSIVWQLEQLPGQQGWLKLDENRREILRAASEVWDYSPENVAFLADRGVDRVKLLPFGFHEGLQTIERAEPDIDVLFYGSINARRKAVLNDLAARCRTKVVFGVYGQKRAATIARSKIVLNLHAYPAQIMEQSRVSYLLNNRCFVVSEESLPNPYDGALATAPYEGLVDCCLRYLDDPGARDRMAEAGYDFLARRPMTAYLRAVLD